MIFLLVYILLILKNSSASLTTSMNNYNNKRVEEQFITLKQRIFGECLSEKFEPLVIIANYNKYNNEFIFNTPFRTIILIGAGRLNNLEYAVKTKRYAINPETIIVIPAKYVIIAEFNIKSLRTNLNRFKDSVFWNINAHFLIINTNGIDTCSNAYLVLKVLWEFNILSALFLCQAQSFDIHLYTFNPYSQSAPKFWRKLSFYKQQNGHFLTLFRNLHPLATSIESSLFCESIWYPKTKDLSNFPIKIAGRSFYSSTLDDNTNTINDVDGYRVIQDFISIIWKKLNANLTIIDCSADDLGEIDNNGIPSGNLKDVLHGKYEIIAITDYQRGIWKNELNTFLFSGVCFVTMKEKIPIIDELLKEFSSIILLIFISFLAIITIVLRKLTQISYMKITLDVLRGLIGVSMIHTPNSKLGKIIFLLVLYVFMIMNLRFQSYLSAILTTTSVKDLNIHSINDLIKSGYKIYNRPYLKQFYHNTPLYNSNLYTEDLLECLFLMKTDSNIACVEDCDFARYAVSETDDIRFSSDEFFDRYEVIPIRDDSPLYDAVQKIYYWLFESGIINNLLTLDKLKNKKPSTTANEFKIITLPQLIWIFSIFNFFYLCSIILFLVEKGISKKKGNVRKKFVKKTGKTKKSNC